MNVAIICSSDYMAIPAARKLKDMNMLSGIIIPEKFKHRMMPSFLQSGFDLTDIHALHRDDIEDEIPDLLQCMQADCVFVITFPWKLPEAVLNAIPYGCINFHPGLIPKYRGADPIYWQIRNREPFGGVTVHKMTDIVDEGPVLLIKETTVIPGETYGIHHNRLGAVVAETIPEIIEIVKLKQEQLPSEYAPAKYFNKPSKRQITINWEEQSSEDIEAMINAGNPKYNGAYTRLRGMELSILEVSFTEVNDIPHDTPPGTIVYADLLYGPIVVCADRKCVKINMACMPEGYISGSKLVSLGFGSGDRFN